MARASLQLAPRGCFPGAQVTMIIDDKGSLDVAHSWLFCGWGWRGGGGIGVGWVTSWRDARGLGRQQVLLPGARAMRAAARPTPPVPLAWRCPPRLWERMSDMRAIPGGVLDVSLRGPVSRRSDR